MDSQKFGTFISELRKERGWTQLELAQKLNVTDKAVSKWERGAGFPDIKLIEPLADALGVSILEIMKSEKICEPKIPTENANETMSQIIDIAILQKKIEKRNLAIGIICAALAVAIVFLLDLMDGIGFFMVYLPVFAVAMGVVLGIMGIRKRHISAGIMIGLGIAFVVLVIIMAFLFYAFTIGGPVPT